MKKSKKAEVLYVVTVKDIEIPMGLFRDFDIAESTVHQLLGGYYIGYKTEKYSDKTTEYCHKDGHLKAWISERKVV